MRFENACQRFMKAACSRDYVSRCVGQEILVQYTHRPVSMAPPNSHGYHLGGIQHGKITVPRDVQLGASHEDKASPELQFLSARCFNACACVIQSLFVRLVPTCPRFHRFNVLVACRCWAPDVWDDMSSCMSGIVHMDLKFVLHLASD